MKLVNQFFGLGDIIFCQSLFSHERVLWPVLPGYVEGLNRAYPRHTFVDWNLLKLDYNRKDFYSLDGLEVIPLRWSYEILKVPFTMCMKSKYMLFQRDWQDWKRDAQWVWDMEKESQLMEQLGLEFGEPYTLVNTTFRADFSGKRTISLLGPLAKGMKVVEMKQLNGFSLFDWARVIENATEIHTVSTSIIYLMELLNLKAERVHIYLRRPDESNHKNYDYILQRHNYILH